MNRLTVSKIEVAQNQLKVSFDCKGQIRKFFVKNKFIAEYDTPVKKVPEAILVIPFLATIAPIAWANQAEVLVGTIDATFLSSLNRIRKTLQKFYPQIKFTGDIKAENVVSPCVEARTRRMMLFSGGIDSLTTFIRHQDENPILVSAQETDFLTNRKKKAQNMGQMDVTMNISSKYLEDFSSTTKSENRIIVSNWISILDSCMLGIYQKQLSGGWYTRVMHGLAFDGLCAPLAYIEKVEKLYIASSFTADAQIPWGSHPDIDNNTKWTGTRVEHDGYELSRQDKIFLIADYIKKKPGLKLRSCSSGRVPDENCSRCEKCSRTILGLELAGVDPNKHGFSVDAGTFLFIKKNLEDRTWRFGDDEVYMWTDIQKHASNAKEIPHYEAGAIVDWLRNVDVESLRVKPSKSRLADPFFKMLPYPIYKLFKKSYIKFNERFYRK